MTKQKYDLIIVGAGIVGLAIGYKYLLKNQVSRLLIIEKETHIASHQTGHNSGVIHSGIYYKPGSLKAKNCIDGASQLHRFCEEEGIPTQECGKLIIATEEEELHRLQELYNRGSKNGVKDLQIVDRSRVVEIEPEATLAIKGLYSPHTSIVNFVEVAEILKKKIEGLGGIIQTGTECKKIEQNSNELVIQTNQGEIFADYLINCGGIWSVDVARSAGLNIDEKMIPFRGEYYELSEQAAKKIRGLIYPVPDPAFPFLGVHLTKMMGNKVEAGPNAVLALAKDGYTNADISPSHLWSLISYPGFWKMSYKYWKTGVYEWYRSFSKQAFLQSLQRLAPELKKSDMIPGGAGIRAQLVRPDGTLCDDFVIKKTERMTHILNAPSPAATACLAIADSILKELPVRSEGGLRR